MKVKALTSFAGPVTMFGGEVRDITDKKALKDLLKCGYVEAVENANTTPPVDPEGDADGEENNNAEGEGGSNPEGDGSDNTEPPAEPKANKNNK